jgi:hypothetical protein
MSLTPISSVTRLIFDGEVTNPKLANMAESTIKGRVSSGAGVPEDLSAAQVRTVLGITAAGAALIDDATAADQRTTMGVAYGTTGTTVCVGNDSRLSDPRTPVAHNQAWSTITATPTTISGYGLTDAASTGANTFTGAQLIRAAATQDAIEILPRAGGTSSFKASITPLALSASRTWSLPDRSDTFAGLKSNTFTEAQIIGTDPGGPELLRVGGGLSIANGGAGTPRTVFSQVSDNPTQTMYRWSGSGSDYYASCISLVGGNIEFQTCDATAAIGSHTFASRVKILNSGAQIIGTDPGGSELLRVGGSVNIASGQGYKVAGTKVVGGQASAIADVSTADATDLASAIALANANKAKINSILAMLRTHGLIAT